MALLYQRTARLTVDTFQVEGLRITFKVSKKLSGEPAELEATVYNLNETHRAQTRMKGAKVILEAGYGSDLVRLFSGDARYCEHTREGPDWVTKIQCGDGERAYRYAYVSESFAPGTYVRDVFRKVAGATGLDVRDACSYVDALIDEQFTQGFSVFGKASTAIETLLKGRGLEHTVIDGRLQVLEAGKPAKNSAVLLSPSTGLIGSPSHGTPETGKKGATKPQMVKAKSLLNGRITPGALVRIESVQINGNFRAQDVMHTGDTFGSDWYTEIEALPV